MGRRDPYYYGAGVAVITREGRGSVPRRAAPSRPSAEKRFRSPARLAPRAAGGSAAYFFFEPPLEPPFDPPPDPPLEPPPFFDPPPFLVAIGVTLPSGLQVVTTRWCIRFPLVA